ncbi:hypothetical protein HK405_005231 [Cladochytrium tenue]|nr:hypothetical protein HK405_005231 [Cladochytrium tenue]
MRPLTDIVFAIIVRDLPLPDLRALAATSRAYRALVASVAAPRLLFLLSRLLFATIRLGNAASDKAAAADIRSGRPAAAPRAASQLAVSAAFVAEIVAAAARSLPAAASDSEAAAAAVHAAMCAVWSHANAHWVVNGNNAHKLKKVALRRTEALAAIERAAAVVVRGEDDGDNDVDDAMRGVARGVLAGLSSSERLDMWRAVIAQNTLRGLGGAQA